MNGKEIISKLKAEGWQLNRINGSHHKTAKLFQYPCMVGAT